MSRAANLASRLAILEERLGSETFTLGADTDTEYTCAGSVIGAQSFMDVGGRETIARGRLFVRRSVLGDTTLASGARLTFRGVTYRVAMVEDIEASLYQVWLGDVNS